MIVYNGVPLTFFQDDGFQLLNGNFAQNLEIQLGCQAICTTVTQKIRGRKIKVEGITFWSFGFYLI